MKDSLLKVINGELINDNAIYFGELRIKISPMSSSYSEGESNRMQLVISKAMDLKIVKGSGSFTYNNVVYTDYATLAAGTVNVFFSNSSTFEVILTDKYSVKSITNGYSEGSGLGAKKRNYAVNIADLEYLDEPVSFWLENGCYGKLTRFESPSSLTNFSAKSDNYEIQLPAFTGCISLSKIDLQQKVVGSILSLSDSTALTYAGFATCTNVTGEINDLAAAQVANGRTSGTLRISTGETAITDDGHLATNSYIRSKGGTYFINITFDSSAPGGYTKSYT